MSTRPDAHNPPHSVDIADLVEKTKKSLDGAEKQMKALKDDRSKLRKGASKYVKVLLQPATQVCTVLDALSSIYPATGIVSKTLTAVIKMETDRRENDARILVLFPKFTSALLALSQLPPFFEPDPEFERQLEEETSNISTTLQQFANFSDVYYKRKVGVIYHLVHSNSEKEKLLEFSSSIDMHKTELSSLVGRQALNVVSGIRTTVTTTGANVDVLVKYFVTQARDEKESQAREFLDANGGEEEVQNDPRLLAKFARKFDQRLTDRLQDALKESLDDALSNNMDLFDLRFRAAQDLLRVTVENSYEMIMAEIKSGPYTRIENEEARDIWKGGGSEIMSIYHLLIDHIVDMTKSGSVKGRLFIHTLADHYDLAFKRYRAEHDEDHADKWTLHFLNKVSYHPAIGDAIDEDGSGYISVSELNEFLREKPQPWSIPQWLAYWAYGWVGDLQEYTQEIGSIFFRMKEIQKTFREPNKSNADTYLGAMKDISKLTIYPQRNLSDTEQQTGIDDLRSARHTALEQTMEERLRKLHYVIDDSTSIAVVIGSGRLESSLTVLIALLLRYHLKIFKVAKTKRIAEDTFLNMQFSLESIFAEVRARVEELRDAWRQNRLDQDDQFKHFGGGIFEDFWDEIKDNDPSYVYDDEDSEYESDGSSSGYFEEEAYDFEDQEPVTQNSNIGQSDTEGGAEEDRGGELGEHSQASDTPVPYGTVRIGSQFIDDEGNENPQDEGEEGLQEDSRSRDRERNSDDE